MNSTMVSVLRYQSTGVCIHDAMWAPPETASGQRLVLEPDSMVFIRSGTLRVQFPCSIPWLDVNHVLAVSQGAICEPTGECGGSCTILRFDHSAFGAVPFLHGEAATRLSTPAVFLRHWHALCWARSRRNETRLIERAASGVFEEFRADIGAGGLTRRASHAALVTTIKTAIHRNGDAPPSLEELATSLGMSPFTISHVFHREVGISIRHYCKRLRLRKALRLMLETSADLSSIAMDLGFFDQAHFSNAFRQDFGMPPSLVAAVHRHRSAIGLAM